MKTFEDFMKTFSKIEPLSNFKIIDKCKELKIRNFKGVFMRDELNGKATDNECLILNIDHSSNKGTHWVSLFIKHGICYYFDSYGFQPPNEAVKYCDGIRERRYSTFKIQKPGQVICGHFCIYVLLKLGHDVDFCNIMDELYRFNIK